MKVLIRLTVLTGVIAAATITPVFAQMDTVWTDHFLDGDYTNNWTWTITSGTAQVTNHAMVLQGSTPYNDANASCPGDPAHPHASDHYGFYYNVKIQGTGTPAAVANVKDDATTFYLVELYPPNNAIWVLKGVYPNPADYKKSATSAAVRMDSTINVHVDIWNDTLKIKVWNGSVEPTGWDLVYDTASTSLSPWLGIQLGGWWLNNAILTFDNIVSVSQHVTSMAEPVTPSSRVTQYSLAQNYPNPFNPSTTIEFQLASRGIVTLSIFDELGRQVATLINQDLPSGTYRTRWNGVDDQGRQLSSGMYFYRLRAGNFSGNGKMLMLK